MPQVTSLFFRSVSYLKVSFAFWASTIRSSGAKIEALSRLTLHFKLYVGGREKTKVFERCRFLVCVPTNFSIEIDRIFMRFDASRRIGLASVTKNTKVHVAVTKMGE